MKDRKFIKGAITGVAGTLAAVLALQAAGIHVISGGNGVLSNSAYVEKLEYIESMIDSSYLGEIDEDDLAEGMYAGLISGLGDPYSRYYTAEEYAEENTYTEGSYVGIGIVMEKNEEGGVRIVSCYEGGPGEAAGLLAGDLIVGIDGEDIRDLDTSEVANRVRNCGKDQIVLTVYHENAEDSEDITVEVTTVELPAVSYEMLEDSVGYIRISEFTGVAYSQYVSAFSDLEEQGMEKLIVDLRDNPGGLLTSVCDILNEILPEGLIVYTEDKDGNRDEKYSDGEHELTMPLAVLINENSASASEIFAGAVKDYGIGTLVGTTTYGKGVVQALQQLNDGSAVKLTIANYYTPNGNNIHKIGVEPDVEVKLDESLLNRSYTKEEDNQIAEALKILQN
jgi:carboxyl-terminal processing protease